MIRCLSLLISFSSLSHVAATFLAPQFSFNGRTGRSLRAMTARRVGTLRSSTTTSTSSEVDTLLELDNANYSKILNDKNKAVVLVDCCAQWCGPCKLIEPTVKRCAEKWSDVLHVARFDIDKHKNSDLKLELVLQNVLPRKLPSLILFQNGKAISQRDGVVTDKQLDEFLISHLDGITSVPKKKFAGAGSVNLMGVGGGDDYMLSA